jgi:hypothetical protein
MLAIRDYLERNSMANHTSDDFINDEVPQEAYIELRRWLGKWANQDFDLDKRLAAFITLENLNSFVETMLGKSLPKSFQ